MDLPITMRVRLTSVEKKLEACINAEDGHSEHLL